MDNYDNVFGLWKRTTVITFVDYENGQYYKRFLDYGNGQLYKRFLDYTKYLFIIIVDNKLYL